MRVGMKLLMSSKSAGANGVVVCMFCYVRGEGHRAAMLKCMVAIG